MTFVHLKVFSEFSINKGINTIKGLIESAKSKNMGAIALTDDNGLFGSIQFYEAAKSKGIKPIIGLTAHIEQEDGNIYQLTMLAKNENGYRKLVNLNSRAYTENRKKEDAQIKEDWLVDLEDVIVLSGAKKGLIGQLILANKMAEARLVAQQMRDFFGGDFFMELQRDGTTSEDTYMEGATKIASELNIPPVATHPVFFENREDFFAHEARYCISHHSEVFDIKRPKYFNKEMYFKTAEEMQELFQDIPEAIENTVVIAKKCNIKLMLNKPRLPVFPAPKNENVNDYFATLARQGLKERLQEDFLSPLDRERKRKEYEDRLEKEIKIIQNMGFPGYFLIVADFINWAKSQDIPVGPGRGSGAGSLVAYSMRITDINPLPFGLLFERFLNPDRVSMPDFDIDFCQARRGEVYEYVRQKYGVEAVCQIGTFGTMAAKAVVRDVGRTLNHSYDFVDTLAKMINIRPNNPMSLREFIFGNEDKNIEADRKVLDRYENEPDVKKLIDIALKIEGITKQTGLHAAGVVIADGKLTDFVPLYVPSEDAPPQTQFEMNDVEKMGLVKFDFLGLKTLTIIKDAIDLIHAQEMDDNGIKLFDIRKIPIDDADVYKNIYANGNTVGIFQFESKGMASTLQKANPEKLQDLIAINALYRPGPMDIIPDWLAAKKVQEDKRVYPHPLLEEVLRETYGFMIYQEQVMQCAQVIANYSLGEADLLRRAMGKKKPEEMRKQREVFINGASKNNVSEQKANELFDLIDKFSGYGFNKSHAAAYSFLSYQLGYLKQYYPEQFYCANLNSNLGILDTDKIVILHQDAEKNGIKILPPNINKSHAVFKTEDIGAIRYALNAIKGVGEKAAQTIVNEREKRGNFIDFYDFLERTGKGHVNKRVIEALIKAGALDDLHPNRAELFDNIEIGLDYVAKFRKKQMENMSVLGDAISENAIQQTTKTRKKKEVKTLIRPEFKIGGVWEDLESAKLEKSVFGYYFSSNPYKNYYLKELGGFPVAMPLADISETYKTEYITEVFIGGLIEDINWWKSKKGAFVTISDGVSSTVIRAFEGFLNENKDWVKKDSFLAARLRVENSDDEDLPLLTVQQGLSFEKIKELSMQKLYVGIDNNEENIRLFNEVISNFGGDVSNMEDSKNSLEVALFIPDNTGRRRIQTKQVRVKYDENLIKSLIENFGENWVRPVFKKDINKIKFPEIERKNGYNKNSNSRQKKISFSS